MSAFSLICSVCKATHKGNADWLRHLLQEKHQILARKELANWEEAERTSVLVVFGRQAVGKDDSVVQFLSKDFGTFVTDFVWWPERPRVGFVQFESSEKMKEVMGTLQNCQFRVDPEQLCQVREGGSIPELEWLGLFPECEPTPEHSNAPEQPHPSNPPSKPTELLDSGQQLRVEKDEPSILGSSLKSHLSSIRKLIEITDEEYNFALEINHQVQCVLGQKSKKESPSEAVISRHWMLKLQYSPKFKDKNIPLGIIICKYLDTNTKDPCGAVIDRKSLKKLDNKLIRREKQGKQSIFSYELLSTRHEQVLTSGHAASGFINSLRYCLRHPTTSLPFTFNILGDRRCVVESQVWRLFEYLCTFDPHCFPVLSVVYYWARTNSITVGGSDNSYCDLPDPSGLNWLLVLFFQMEGMIPSPRQILQQPHGNKLLDGVSDIGFSDSGQFAITWRANKNKEDANDEQFAENVFNLVYKFFYFCTSKLGSHGECQWIVNTRDAEIIPLQDFLESSSSKMENCHLTGDEITKVKGSLENGNCDKIIMLHPFILNWRISTSNAEDAFEAMRKTGMRLKDNFKNGTRKKLSDFLSLFKIL